MSKARSALLATLVLVPLALVAGTMKQTVAQIPVPTDTNPLSVSTLAYKAWFTAQIASVRLESIPAPGADPVELSWVFTGSNTDAQMHRVSITVTLVDETGQKLASTNEKTALRPGTREQSIPLRMTVPARAWSAAKTVRLSADWFS